jgi:hypothetical protein
MSGKPSRFASPSLSARGSDGESDMDVSRTRMEGLGEDVGKRDEIETR